MKVVTDNFLYSLQCSLMQAAKCTTRDIGVKLPSLVHLCDVAFACGRNIEFALAPILFPHSHTESLGNLVYVETYIHLSGCQITMSPGSGCSVHWLTVGYVELQDTWT